MCLCILGLDDRRNERRKLKKKKIKRETLKVKLEVIKIKCTKKVIILGIQTNFDFVCETCKS